MTRQAPCDRRPAPPELMVIVDTEEEFDWSRPFSRQATAVGSIAEQMWMHRIFDRFGIVPTYAVDWPVATTASSVGVLRPLLESGRCEIATHLHPWVNPPFEEEVGPHLSYPGNLPPDLEHRKLALLTDAIAANFGIRPRAYKAGRYGLGRRTPEILAALGYHTDLSVVPHTSFANDGGPDFRGAPDRPFWLHPAQRVLALPMSVGFVGRLAGHGPALQRRLHTPWCSRLHLSSLGTRLGLLERLRLTPEGNGFRDLVRLTRAMLTAGHRQFTFAYHSPSLGIGHTPYVRSAAERKDFLTCCERYFDFFAGELGGRFTTVSRSRAAYHHEVAPLWTT